MITSEGQNNRSEAYEEEDAISLLDLMLVFARHKKKIIIVPFLAGCAMAGYSLIVPEIFTASTTLIPSDRKQSSAMAMLSQLGRSKPSNAAVAMQMAYRLDFRSFSTNLIAMRDDSWSCRKAALLPKYFGSGCPSWPELHC